VYVEVPGTLSALETKAGRQVKKGELLARLESIDLDLEIARLEQQRDEQQVEYQTLGRQRFADPQALARLPQAREALRSTEEQLVKRLENRRTLMLTSPTGWRPGTAYLWIGRTLAVSFSRRRCSARSATRGSWKPCWWSTKPTSN
jgi:hypothetical protein